MACAATTPPAAPPADLPLPTEVVVETEAEPLEPVRSALLPAPEAVPPPPELCIAYAERERHAERPCDVSAALSELDSAVSETEPEPRDQQLALLERCEHFPFGWVRALRAELAPGLCADALAAPLLEEVARARSQSEAGTRVLSIPGDVEQLLVGLSLAARLQRLTEPVPEAPAAANKQQFKKYFEQELKPWVMTRARTVHDLALQGSVLHGYARGVVAVEAAVCDLEFVKAARGVPLPAEMTAEPDVKEAYYAALDEALEPRKRRGRDAALVGIAAFADLGVIQSPRIAKARSILAQSYAGHRITALDSLLLPTLSPLSGEAQTERLLATLPTFHTQHLLKTADVTQPSILRALLATGLPPAARGRLDAAPLSNRAAALYARALLALGQRYWRADYFSRAAAVLDVVPRANERITEEHQLLHALAEVLKAGPKDAAQMMIAGPLLPAAVGEVAALDALSDNETAIGGMAAYNAAYLLSLLPPQADVKQFWNGITARYETAAKKLEDPYLVGEAQARADAARQTAKAVR